MTVTGSLRKVKTFSKKSIELAFAFPEVKSIIKSNTESKPTWAGGVLARWLIRRLYAPDARHSVGAAARRARLHLS